MTAQLVEQLESSESPPSDFIHGKTYIHPTGEEVNFEDDNWIIVPDRGQRVTLNFADFPDWLKRPAKLAAAHLWLEEGRSKSLLSTLLTSLRNVVRLLGDFEGSTLADLNISHVIKIQNKLTTELKRYADAIEKSSTPNGKSASLRELKVIRRESALLGPKSVSSIVSAFNLAATMSETFDNFIVPFRLQVTRDPNVNDLARPVGSADPRKVLTADQVAELELALRRDFIKYEKAISIIHRVLDNVDFTILKKRRPDPLFDLERYFGINGHREHTAAEIASLRGLSPSGEMNVPQLIKRFLSKRIGPDLAAEIITIRSQFGSLKAQRRFKEIDEKRKYLYEVLAQADLTIQNKDIVCLESYFGLNGNRIHSTSAIAKRFGEKSERGVLHRIRQSLFYLIGRSKAKRLLAIRERLAYYLTRAIKAQAVRLQLAVARRISALVKIPAQPKIEIEEIEGRRVVKIQFHARKTWGEEGLEEWVPCVDTFGEIAEDAIDKTKALTKDLRIVATAQDAEKLFIIPDSNSFEHAVSLTAKVLQEYIYTTQPGKEGILQRYALEGLLDFEFHHIRHTNSTHMQEHDGTIHDTADYLGHRRYKGDANVAATFYLAGGTKEMRARTAEALRCGAATGRRFDAIARLKIEAMGEEAKQAPVPPNQLSIEEAVNRISTEDIVDYESPGPEEAVQLLKQGLIVNITDEGGCILLASTGYCPTANPCPIGIDPEQSMKHGCGCEHFVLMPHSEESLMRDIEVMEAELKAMVGNEYVAWRAHTQAKLRHWYKLLGDVRTLKPLMEIEKK